ncbi:lytic murein transglycosylase [Rhodoplanes sp. TEM]|uniref:Lytic murein transglycosylase n=1 Tax=Rhodoplanes tepidamans TaxID=200616 RepID=A0ABT5JAZ8_RHOTP|nr:MULTISPECIES: lytic murein transglycosylase [Rhodoplanes]MDC7786561.1 lytic murein transglycosylase [Rhodoplanes tepidamans]MDC7983101.1 lytic murein transglycosylase [Rhodoplanes sp. TEM]MDQ0357559.1 lytic murein transglycosylase [Rhodoplanes tepidamans]
MPRQNPVTASRSAIRTARTAALVLGLSLAGLSGALAQAPCRTTGSFESWLERFKQEAIQQSISRQAIAAAAPYLVYDQRIVNIDRGQKFFAQSFLQFSDKVLPAYRLQKGGEQLKKHAALFARAEQQYGVPGPVIVAFWGLESDFGVAMGKDHAIRSLATLAYDCRRSEMFRGHLFDALRMIERGDLQAAEMVGSWAGELGQTQMMPSEYMKHAIDWDGDGHRNLLKSVPDVIGSSASYLQELGWRRGEPWLREVKVPASMPWDQADLAIQHPHAKWAGWGVTLRDGRPLPAGGPPASLLLPMGRLGPAFLAYPNFQAYLKWNASLVYATTAAYYATRLAGAPPMSRGAPTIPVLNQDEAKELQELLNRAGFDVGTPDGKIGAGTRAAVKQAQSRFGLPADSYATPELITRLRAGR